MELKTTKERVLEEASKSEEAKKILSNIFPECFGKICVTTTDGYDIRDGEEYYVVYQKHSFVQKEFGRINHTYGSDFNHTRFKSKELAEKCAVDNNVIGFTFNDIIHACCHVDISTQKRKELIDFLQKGLDFHSLRLKHPEKYA